MNSAALIIAALSGSAETISSPLQIASAVYQSCMLTEVDARVHSSAGPTEVILAAGRVCADERSAFAREMALSGLGSSEVKTDDLLSWIDTMSRETLTFRIEVARRSVTSPVQP